MRTAAHVMNKLLQPSKRLGEQITHIWSSAEVSEDQSDTDDSEQEVTKPCEGAEKEIPPTQLIRTERIPKPNLKYINATILDDNVKEPETYEEASQNKARQTAMEEEITTLEHNQTWELVRTHFRQVGLQNKASPRWVNREIQGSSGGMRVLSAV
ncbi:hypothetical protein L1887_37728 [Cichorium endivia]|nr:hypothetical protein L1887_37728 [Cichorium endivia]